MNTATPFIIFLNIGLNAVCEAFGMKKWLRIENNSHNKIVYSLKELLLIIILWITAALLFVFIKLNGLSDSYVTQGYQLYNWVSVMRIYSVAFLCPGL